MDLLILCDSKDYSERVSLALWSFCVRFFGEKKQVTNRRFSNAVCLPLKRVVIPKMYVGAVHISHIIGMTDNRAIVSNALVSLNIIDMTTSRQYTTLKQKP